MQLSQLLETYCLCRAVSPRYRQQLAIACGLFGRHLGRPAATADLADDTVNRWLVAYANGRRPHTVRGKRTALLVLWRWGYAEGFCEQPPRRVRKIVLPRLLPEAWGQADLRNLLAAAGSLSGHIRRWRVPWRSYYRALILVGYDSGLRLGDLLVLRWEQIEPDGTLLVVQGKTNWPLLARLRPETLATLEAIRHPEQSRPLALLKPPALRRGWKRVLLAAGLRGAIQQLRRSGATSVEASQPGAATAYLGHRTPGIAQRHYVDPRIARQAVRQPPPLVG